jgi:2-amino-4-hydroxy-6-hydroxymethyldihydropteridine diphosphokinase
MIFIAIGANLPGPDGCQPIDTCRKALMAISAVPGLRLLAASGWWQSAAVPPSDQPPYINGVAGLEGAIAPDILLKHLQSIELEFGRVRLSANAARTLDLDIIAMGSLVRPSPDPTLPHPRAHQRAFVLEPLREIAPQWVHPLMSRTASCLLADVKDQICDRIADSFDTS